MKFPNTILLLFSIFIHGYRALENIQLDKTGKIASNRLGRTYDQIFQASKGGHADKGDDEGTFGFIKGNPSQAFSSFKVSNYPQFGYSNKGESFYRPSVKGGFQFPSNPDQSDGSSISNSNDNKKEGGLVSSLLSEKPLAAAAIIPLSLFMAAVLPGLMNYLTTGLNPQVQQVQTTVTNKKEARQINGNLDNVLESLVELVNSTDSEENFQKLVCNVAAGEVPLPGSEYIEIAKYVIAQLVQDDRLKEIEVKYILNFLQKNNCDKRSSNFETATV